MVVPVRGPGRMGQARPPENPGEFGSHTKGGGGGSNQPGGQAGVRHQVRDRPTPITLPISTYYPVILCNSILLHHTYYIITSS